MRSDVNRGSALLGTERPRSTRHWHTIKCRNSQCDCNSECRAHDNNNDNNNDNYNYNYNYNYNDNDNYNYNDNNNYDNYDNDNDCTHNHRADNSGAVSNGTHFDNNFYVDIIFIFKHDFNVND